MKAHTPLRKGDVLVFEHIHKAAGTTLTDVLKRRYRRDLFVHHAVANPEPRLAELAARIEAKRPPRAIVTHLGYGFQERLPGDLRYVYFTLLRDPIERTISAYYSLIQAGKLKASTSLVEFCTTDNSGAFPLRVHNFQTSCLSGLRAEAQIDGRVPQLEDFNDELLERAKRNLDTFAAVGLIERFDDSLLLIGRTFGWPLYALRYVRRNQGKQRPKRRELSAEERKVLESVNHLDFELYLYAQERFEALLAERLPDAEERQQARDHIGRLNRTYQRVVPVLDRLRGITRRAQRAFKGFR